MPITISHTRTSYEPQACDRHFKDDTCWSTYYRSISLRNRELEHTSDAGYSHRHGHVFKSTTPRIIYSGQHRSVIIRFNYYLIESCHQMYARKYLVGSNMWKMAHRLPEPFLPPLWCRARSLRGPTYPRDHGSSRYLDSHLICWRLR